MNKIIKVLPHNFIEMSIYASPNAVFNVKEYAVIEKIRVFKETIDPFKMYQENQQLKQALLDIKEYIETKCSKKYCTNSRFYITDGLKKDLIFKINKALGSDSYE